MPRNRLLAQIDEELVHARHSLKFWRDQQLILTGTEFEAATRRQVRHREADIKNLLEAQELLLDGGPLDGTQSLATRGSPDRVSPSSVSAQTQASARSGDLDGPS